MNGETSNDLARRIATLKRERRCIILAHNYQIGEVQDVADFVGDSLGLAQIATKLKAEVILLCGVYFMAETVKILCPDKKVIIPDLNAGCSLADKVNSKQLREWKKKYPQTVIVCYVNTTAEVKAECDYCCTSTNGLKVIEAIPKNKEILFVPDMYLGSFLRRRSGRNLQIWPGYCHSHIKIREEDIQNARELHPEAEVLIHPECGCITACMDYGDRILSTEGIRRHCNQSTKREFIIGTEIGMLYRLKKENPDKAFYPASEKAICEYMKLNTLEKLVWSLENLQYEIKVSDNIAQKARRSIERMMDII